MTTLSRVETAKPLRTARRLTLALYLYAGWYLLWAVATLEWAARIRGERYIPAQGDGYAESWKIWTGLLAPLKMPVLLTAGLGHLVAGVVVVVAVVRLADPQVRAARRTWTWLLVGTLLVIGTIVLANSAPGVTLRGWILD